MGHSEAPPAAVKATFPLLSDRIEGFLQALGQRHLVFYMTDFGALVGMRIVLRHPDWIDGLIFQNAVVSLDGLSAERVKQGEGPVTDEARAAAERFVSLKTAIYLYRTGARNPTA